jgi:hypothetical protein
MRLDIPLKLRRSVASRMALSILAWSGRLTHRTALNVPDTAADPLHKLESDNVLLFHGYL